MIRKKLTKRQPTTFVIANHRIRYPQVRVLAESGEMVGMMSPAEAMQIAMDQEKDLVLVTDKSNPPVCKIIEISKFKYQLKQKDAESRKNSRNQELKEVRFSPFMGENDFEARANKVIDFLKKGNKVRLSLMFKGRQITKKEFGFEMFNKLFARTTDIAIVEIEPKLLGKKLQAQLAPSKKQKT
ncbi:MAG: translation initiation factor IF-3 [Patescibacteria group bacterium]